ncbi:hypothetical protein SprV_0200906600 [Sparganum proliferum]
MTSGLPTYIPHANRPRRTPPETMHQQHGKVKSSSHKRPYCRPCCKPRKDNHPVIGDQTADVPPPSISGLIRPAPSPASTTATSSVNITASRTPPTDGTTSDVPSSTTITINTPHLQ